MPYLVFNNVQSDTLQEREVVGAYLTLAEANAVAMTNPNFMVSPEIPNEQIRLAEPGWFFTAANAIEPVQVLAGTQRLRDAYRTLYSQLISFSERLRQEGYAEPNISVEKAHDFIYQAHVAAFRVGASSDFTVDQKVTWAIEMAKWPTDAETPSDFYLRLEGLTAPDHPNTWVDPRNGTRTTLEAGKTLSALSPPGGLGFSAAKLPPGVHIGSGSWIEDLMGR